MIPVNQPLIDLINQEIRANGAGLITATMLNDVLQKILDAVPDRFFKFPRHSSVLDSDLGKLMMNVNGVAKVANTSGAKPGQKGVWTIDPLSGEPYLPPMPPMSRIIYANYGGGGYGYGGYGYGYGYGGYGYGGGGAPQDGDTFTLTLSNGATEIYTFRNTPTLANDVPLAPTGYGPYPGPYYALSGKINTTATVMAQGISSYNNTMFSRIEIWDYMPSEGLHLNAAYTGNGFDSVTVHQNGSTGYANGSPYIDSLFLDFSTKYYDEDDNFITAYCKLNFSDVFNISAPSGTIFEGHKYPQSKAEYADDIMWILTNTTVKIENNGVLTMGSLTDYVDITRAGNLVTIQQKEITEGAYFFIFSADLAPLNYQTITEPKRTQAAFMQYVILGVLTGMDNANVYIDKGEIVTVNLDSEVVFDILDNDNYTCPADISARLLLPVDDGKVAPVFHNGRPNPQTIDPPSSLPVPTRINRSCTLTYFEALEEGDAGAKILARRFTFLMPFFAVGFGQ